MLTKWVFPHPAGPNIFMSLLGHLGQFSISLYALKLFLKHKNLVSNNFF